MFIIDRCHRSLAAVSPVKYERDSVSIMIVYIYFWTLEKITKRRTNSSPHTWSMGLTCTIYVLWWRQSARLWLHSPAPSSYGGQWRPRGAVLRWATARRSRPDSQATDLPHSTLPGRQRAYLGQLDGEKYRPHYHNDIFWHRNISITTKCRNAWKHLSGTKM